MRELIGVVPPDDREGVLQDIHWPTGAIGYFPCYTLGAMMAAQLFEALSRPSPTCPRRSPTATSRRCSPGCAPTSTSRARCSRRRSCWPARPAARSSRTRSCATSKRATWRERRGLIEFLVAADGTFNWAASVTLEEGSKLAHRSLRCYAEGCDGDWEAICLDLDVAVQGGSFEEVFASLQEAISLYLESVTDLPPEERRDLLHRPAPFPVRFKFLAHALRGLLADSDDHRQRHQFTMPLAA